jgi:uncharacterized low-complexity protein
MSDKTNFKPLAIAVSAAFVSSLAGTSIANAAQNPFAMTELPGGYMVAAGHEGKCGGMKSEKEGKCGEGKCGGMKSEKEGKCGEGKCGMKTMDADGDGSITKQEFMQGHEAMFNKMDTNSDGVVDTAEQHSGMKEGKCGEGKCGSMKMEKEGKCGEGKCGGMK